MSAKIIVSGVGMTPFLKPGTSPDYDAMGEAAIREALTDAGASYDLIQQAYAGYVYGDSTAGQRTVYRVGLTGIPVINVNNNCATGSTALFLARQAVESGAVDCALAVGFEQMRPGALGDMYDDRPSPLKNFLDIADEQFEEAEKIPMAIRLFAGAGYEYQQRYGASNEAFAQIRVKAARHAVHNDKAIFRSPLELDDVLTSPNVFLNTTRLQCCPPTCGAAAAVICSEDFARRHGLRRDVVMLAQAMTTDTAKSFDERSMMEIVGSDLSRRAADTVYEKAGVGPYDIRVAELHDCFTTNELLTYEALGLCGEGEAERFIFDGENTYGGACVTNPSGGLLSKGHPLGATGLAQCYELVSQLRGTSGARQVEGVDLALQHNIGLGGAAVVGLYGKA